jgi:nitronate monooxygenase
MEDKIKLTDLLGIEYPIIMAPMFLVSNTQMIIEGLKAGVTGAIPALNYRSVDELREAIRLIKQHSSKHFGINLIVNKSNFLLEEQLRVCCEEKIGFIITSLGSPELVINEAHKHNILVFCDVTNVKYARKVEGLGADAIIAVNKEAGGHAGTISYKQLIPELLANCSIPVISAGGVGNHQQYQELIGMGVAGLSIGSVFIASEECGVSTDYKQACVDYGAKDIVLTTKLSGTPCTVINTPYVQEVGTKQNWLEQLLNKNKLLKKWFKALTFYRGMKFLRSAAFNTTYKSVWCAGPSIEHVRAIRPVKEIVNSLVTEN